jgi:hypothetical protein
MNEITLLLAAVSDQDWLSRHATLVVGVVGIVFSGLIGPSVSAGWVSRRERRRDHQTTIIKRREDLQLVVDEAAKILGGAVSHLRPLLAAKQANKPLPTGPADLLKELVPLGQRLQLRLPESHQVLKRYEGARKGLIQVSHADSSQAEFDEAADKFESLRGQFLDAARAALQAPITKKGVI